MYIVYKCGMAVRFVHTLVQAAVVSDVIVLYVLGKRSYYRRRKYLNVNDPVEDDYQIIDGDEREEVT